MSDRAEEGRGKGVFAPHPGIDIWRVALTPSNALAVQPHLSEDEKAKAESFFQPRHRRAFVAARGMLRRILAGYLAAEPNKIIIDQVPGRKPVLGDVHASSDLRFNVSKSADVAYVAVSHGSEIGLDVETWRPQLFDGSVAEEILSPTEMTVYRTLPSAQQPQFVCQSFTRKEAVLKACGEGLAVPLSEIEIDRTDMVCSIALKWLGGYGQAGDFVVQDLDFGPGFYGALATSERMATVHYLNWPMTRCSGTEEIHRE